MAEFHISRKALNLGESLMNSCLEHDDPERIEALTSALGCAIAVAIVKANGYEQESPEYDEVYSESYRVLLPQLQQLTTKYLVMRLPKELLKGEDDV